MPVLIILIFLTPLSFAVDLHRSAKLAELTDETVNKEIHFELSSYVKQYYPGCYNKMYSHLKWPDRFERPECAGVGSKN